MELEQSGSSTLALQQISGSFENCVYLHQTTQHQHNEPKLILES